MSSKALLGKISITRHLNSKGGNALGSVIMLHGSCDTGCGMKSWLSNVLKSEFAFTNYKILYPTAPSQKYTLMNGQMEKVWFDRLSLDPNMPENADSIKSTALALGDLIEKESHLTGNKKVVIGGFSTGGTMALHMAYKFYPEAIAGAFTLSSYLSSDSTVFDKLESNKQKFSKPKDSRSLPSENDVTNCSSSSPTPTLDKINKEIETKELQSISNPNYPKLFMSQGTKDPLAKFAWGKSTFDKLREYGIQGHFFTLPSASHEIKPAQLVVLHDWIENVLNPEQAATKKMETSKQKPFHINDQAAIPAYDLE